MNTVNDEAEVTCSGSMFQMRAPATGKSARANGGQSDSRSDQVVGSREPESVTRRHVSNTDELPQIPCTSPVRQDGNLAADKTF